MGNIEVRHTEPSDYQAIWQIHSQPKAIWGTVQTPFSSAEKWRKKLLEESANFYSLVACLEKEVIGSLALWIDPHPRRRHAGSIGMAVHDQHQGKGVGTALMNAATDLADNWLNLLRLELDVYTDNEPAIRLYKKFDFVIEGTQKVYAFRGGSYVDAYRMARVKVVS